MTVILDKVKGTVTAVRINLANSPAHPRAVTWRRMSAKKCQNQKAVIIRNIKAHPLMSYSLMVIAFRRKIREQHLGRLPVLTIYRSGPQCHRARIMLTVRRRQKLHVILSIPVTHIRSVTIRIVMPARKFAAALTVTPVHLIILRTNRRRQSAILITKVQSLTSRTVKMYRGIFPTPVIVGKVARRIIPIRLRVAKRRLVDDNPLLARPTPVQLQIGWIAILHIREP